MIGPGLPREDEAVDAAEGEPEPEGNVQASDELQRCSTSISFYDTVGKSWNDVMFEGVPNLNVESWRSYEEDLQKLHEAGQLYCDVRQKTRPAPHLNLQDRTLMPTPSELAFLRAARNSTDGETDEWLNLLHDEEFKREEVSFKNAAQTKRFLEKSAANFCNLGVQQFEFKDSKLICLLYAIWYVIWNDILTLCSCTARFGKSKAVVTWIDPVETIRALLRHPDLRKPGAFSYAPSFFRDESGTFKTIQLEHSAWFHKAQELVGRDNLVLAIMTNADGTNTTSKQETVFVYLRIGNATAPGGFGPDHLRLIAIVPELKRKECNFDDDEEFQRARLKLFHDSIDKIFETFHKAEEE